jgi:hypothetical protein
MSKKKSKDSADMQSWLAREKYWNLEDSISVLRTTVAEHEKELLRLNQLIGLVLENVDKSSRSKSRRSAK